MSEGGCFVTGMRVELVAFVLGGVLVGAPAGLGQTSRVAREADRKAEAEVAAGTEADTVEAQIAQRDGLIRKFGGGPNVEWWQLWSRKREELFERLGLQMAVSYHALFQGTPAGDGLTGSAGELTLNGSWYWFGEGKERPVDLRFRLRERHAYNGKAPSELGEALGALWGTTRGFTDAGFEVPDLYFRQRLLNRNLELRYGQMVIDSQFDSHSLRGAKRSFLNQAFAANPAVAFPRFGAGATLRWERDDGLDLTGGFSTVQGTQAGDQVDFSFGSGAMFIALQAGYDFAGWGGDAARVQGLMWYSDAVEEAQLPSGEGFSVTFEQKLEDEQVRTFARYAHSSGGASAVRNLLVVGMGRDCGEADLMGLAVGVGQGSGTEVSADGNGDWQGVVEWFYRKQGGPHFNVTPDLQILFGDGFRGSGGDVRFVFGLRGSLTF